MKKLPKIYQNDINKKIINNRVVSYVKRIDNTDMRISVDDKNDVLSSIFSGFGYSYNIPVIIQTTSNTYDTSLITRTRNNVVTLDNDVIAIDDIKYIKIKNP